MLNNIIAFDCSVALCRSVAAVGGGSKVAGVMGGHSRMSGSRGRVGLSHERLKCMVSVWVEMVNGRRLCGLRLC